VSTYHNAESDRCDGGPWCHLSIVNIEIKQVPYLLILYIRMLKYMPNDSASEI